MRPAWKRNLSWWMGGRLVATRAGLALWRKVAAPLDPKLMGATGGHVKLSVGAPIVVLTSIGARSGRRRDTPLTYFTDGDDIVLIASNYGRAQHPAWYFNLLAHPDCELHIGTRGGRFVAHDVTGVDRDRLYALAAHRLNRVFETHEKRSCQSRVIPVVRLTPITGPPRWD